MILNYNDTILEYKKFPALIALAFFVIILSHSNIYLWKDEQAIDPG